MESSTCFHLRQQAGGNVIFKIDIDQMHAIKVLLN